MLSYFLWVIYFFYVLLITFSQFSELKKIEWEKAYLRGHGISNIKGTLNNYTFVNPQNETEVTRSYFSIAGINKSFWGIDETNPPFPITFYLRKDDYDKIMTNDIEFSKDLFGKDTNIKKRIPFFALRAKGQVPSKISLISDLWKYNFSIYSVLFMIIPQAITLINSKNKKFESTNKHQKNLTSTMTFIILIVMGINLVV